VCKSKKYCLNNFDYYENINVIYYTKCIKVKEKGKKTSDKCERKIKNCTIFSVPIEKMWKA